MVSWLRVSHGQSVAEYNADLFWSLGPLKGFPKRILHSRKYKLYTCTLSSIYVQQPPPFNASKDNGVLDEEDYEEEYVTDVANRLNVDSCARFSSYFSWLYALDNLDLMKCSR